MFGLILLLRLVRVSVSAVIQESTRKLTVGMMYECDV